MTWSYDVSLSNKKDQVRFLVGDNVVPDELVQDEEINWTIEEMGDVFASAAMVAESISSQFSGKVDKAVGDLKLKYADQATNYRSLADTLKRRSMLNTKVISAGAQTRAEKAQDEENDSLVDPFYTRTMHDSFPTSSEADALGLTD